MYARRDRTSSMIRRCSTHNPLASPSRPETSPQMDMLVQGNPPETTSTRPFQDLPSKLHTSDQIGKAGRAPSFCRCARICAAYPTNDVRLMTKMAVEALDRVFSPGFKYSKAEVLLLSLCQPGDYTDDFFAMAQPSETDKVMKVLEQINNRW